MRSSISIWHYNLSMLYFFIPLNNCFIFYFVNNIPILTFFGTFLGIYEPVWHYRLLLMQRSYLVPSGVELAILYFLAIVGTNKHRVALTYAFQISSIHIWTKIFRIEQFNHLQIFLRLFRFFRKKFDIKFLLMYSCNISWSGPLSCLPA